MVVYTEYVSAAEDHGEISCSGVGLVILSGLESAESRVVADVDSDADPQSCLHSLLGIVLRVVSLGMPS